MDTVLFDLDGTLLPINQEKFIEIYMGAMGEFVASKGINPKKLIKSMWIGTEAMIQNDGSMTNEERFWKVFNESFGDSELQIKDILDDFYNNLFEKAKIAAKMNPLAKKCVEVLKEKGYEVVLCTNPLFPKIATQTRMRWAGLDCDSFSMITTYENSSFCKPNMGYYKEALKKIGKKPHACIMIGNDVKDDMGVEELGMDTFLLKDHLINKEEKDIEKYKQGDFKELYQYIKELPSIVK
ncbi:MAG: HAD family hydrolase [Clostridiales bacterium]|nr:HAD family hydrolase [Clostridiales bacterium]